MVEDSEGSQRQATANGTNFNTGTYNPIKSDVQGSSPAASAAAPVVHKVPVVYVVMPPPPSLSMSKCPTPADVDLV